ncbi:DUF45 domain-containing protein [Candidatus Dojkabacteria bacterium]|nr:DUF45 domain-containing protein [Candidatus Dojkabacteria bacterium]
MKQNNIEYKVKKSSRAKRISIRITNDGNTIVTLPQKVSKKHAHKFVEQKQTWIKNTLKKINKNRISYNFKQGEKFIFLDDYLYLNFIHKKLVYPRAEITSENINIYRDENRELPKNKIKEVIIKTFKKYFRNLVQEAVEEYNSIYQFKYNRIAIKNNKTNWGSCSSKKNLNFTWRLIFAPLDIIDYVVVHELCHLKEQNHSKKFWKLVSKAIPDYKTRKKWLKENSSRLVF